MKARDFWDSRNKEGKLYNCSLFFLERVSRLQHRKGKLCSVILSPWVEEMELGVQGRQSTWIFIANYKTGECCSQRCPELSKESSSTVYWLGHRCEEKPGKNHPKELEQFPELTQVVRACALSSQSRKTLWFVAYQVDLCLRSISRLNVGALITLSKARS
jgi:hypothetical protein